MVFSGRIYETDGVQAIGVHEADAVRPLSPVPQPPSLRIFRRDTQRTSLAEDDDPSFFYANPSALAGASQLINDPEFTSELGFDPYLAAVIVSDGYRIGIDQADEIVLGITLINLLVARDVEREERKSASGFGRSIDIGGVIGPVLTTPEELDDQVVDESRGRRYALSAVTRVNGVELSRGNTADLPFTLAEAISAASQSCTLKSGDVIAIGPIVDAEYEPVRLKANDEAQIAVEGLGTLSLKLSFNV